MPADTIELVPYTQMKNLLEEEFTSILKKRKTLETLELPTVFIEQGKTKILINLPQFDETILFSYMFIIKKHMENIRIHSFDIGYYAFQSLNKNIFKTDDILDNIKIEISGISTNFKLEISKTGNLSQEEINLVLDLFSAAFSQIKDDPSVRLNRVGASILSNDDSVDWTYIAGYEDVKRNIRESIILPLKNPKIYDSIAKMTRVTYESNRPRAILFEGPPGVGKTTIARIIAKDVNVPLVYVPIESIMSKWYGQSSQNLSEIFDACEDIGGAILFIDEIDSLAGSRDQNMFEATRRVLSVLLRRLDGIDSITSTITIGATNRKGDLDHALISRFDQTISFPLPNEEERAAIFSNYAVHLTEDELSQIAKKCGKLSGRNIKDICETAERRWARRLIIKKLEPSLPPFKYYKHSVNTWSGNNNC